MPKTATNTPNAGRAAKPKGRGPTSSTKRGTTRRPQAPKSTKTQHVLHLLERPKGASITDLMKTTGWQAHSVRGFLSGTVKKKMGLAVVSEKDGKGIRRYRIAMDVAA
jgi:hypothetical protein